MIVGFVFWLLAPPVYAVPWRTDFQDIFFMMNRNMLKKAQQMQTRLAAVQDEIAMARTEATSGGGVVKVSVIGGSKVESIEIDPEVVDPDDVEMLQDLVLAAVNEAMDSAQKLAASTMAEITGGMNIPGLM